MSVNFNRPNRIIIFLAFVALLGLGLWLRLRFIHTVQLYPDEFVTLLAVKMIGQKGLPVMPSGLFYDHGLLFSYVGSLTAWLGPIRWLARYASLLFGLLTLGLIFWLGRRWFSPAVGLIALTGLTIAPAAIEWSSRARMYALLQLLVLATLWLAYEGIVQNKAKLRWAALMTYLGATLTHFVAVTLAPPLVLAGGLVWWQQKAREQRGEGAGEKSPLLPCSSAPLLLSSRASNKAGLSITPCLTTSAMPARNSAGGRVDSTAGSITTISGCLKAPTKFLPWGKSTPTLPPTLASTMASRVVGIWTKGTPRR